MKLFESKTFLSLRNNVRTLELLALSSVIVFLVACSGGDGSIQAPNLGNTPGSITTTVVTTPTVITPEIPVVTYTPGTKNPGGITYTAGDGSVLVKTGDDKITNNLGVPDRVLLGITNMFPGSDASSALKRESLTSDAKLYTEILSLTNDKLPKSKAEAEAILYPQYVYTDFCKYRNVFTNFEVEEVYKRTYLMSLYSKEKIQRYLEILFLGGTKVLGKRCQ